MKNMNEILNPNLMELIIPTTASIMAVISQNISRMN